MEIIYFGILLCSIAFFIAAIYISITLKRLANVTSSLGETLRDVEKQFEYITPQLTKTIQEVHTTIDEISEDMKVTDSVFETVENVGNSINSINDTYKVYKDKITDEKIKKQLRPTVEAIKWGEAAMQVIKKWKRVN
ncbi:DUF948 domain-containing protein [Oceanobacillus sp. Castelsardo]|uniref:DUF948 domain-containing protein n=1 Tax=Oceanobacillus sp. Castelsardo TaxID=1851204 RepID=UPI000837D75F|nr:DUF948 domain-containing protein [Oceanobacillus sp. Castelsardo]